MGLIEKTLEHQVNHLAAAVALEGQQTRAALMTGFAETKRGQRIGGALSKELKPDAVNYTSGGRLVGWSVRADAGTVVLTFHDGQDTSGDVIATLSLADGQSQTQTVMPAGVAFVDALYVESTGTVDPIGAVWIGAVD